MKWIVDIYKKNIYGVMGTLVFHIFLVLAFLLADIDIKGTMREEPIVIEFPEIAQVEKKEMRAEKQAENKERGNMPDLATNRASSRTAPKEDKFFDADYRREMDNARKLASDVNKQLKKEVINIGDIKMPVENTAGMERDSIKNIIYTGKSNITYDLANRYHLSLPIPIYLAQGGGSVVVDILVDRRGSVIKATSRKNSRIRDEQVFFYAELAASRTVFNSDPAAPAQQKGTIRYNFIAQ